MPNPQIPTEFSTTPRRLDQFTLFLKEHMPKGYDDYFAPRMPLFSKIYSVGNIERADMLSYSYILVAIEECFVKNQIAIAFDLITLLNSEFRMTMSIEGKFMESLNKTEMRYTQDQHIHEHVDLPKKKGFLRR